jgi:hypothetical protein
MATNANTPNKSNSGNSGNSGSSINKLKNNSNSDSFEVPANANTNPKNNGSSASNAKKSNNTRTQSISNKITSTISGFKDSVSDKLEDISDSFSDKIGTIRTTIADKTGIDIPEPEDDSIIWTILKTTLFVIILFAILWVMKYFYTNYEASLANAPMLLNGTKNAKQGLVISQNPNNTNYIPITLSEGKKGIEFSYSFWMEIDDFTYKSGQWKHVFHKGNSSSYPNRAPGVWIHPNSNSLRVYMNTQDQILEYVDIDNIPTRKWIHIVLVLRNKNLDVYVNGYLKSRKELSSIPKQNNGDFWVNMFGGFEGYLSNIQYFNQAVSFTTIQTLLTGGPSSSSCMDTGENPPYMDNNWWFSK